MVILSQLSSVVPFVAKGAADARLASRGQWTVDSGQCLGSEQWVFSGQGAGSINGSEKISHHQVESSYCTVLSSCQERTVNEDVNT